MQFVCASMKLRQIFYTQIELRTFHTVWVKNDPDAIQMGCLRYPREQTSASAAAMTDPDPNPLFADGCTAIVCYGNAEPERQADLARADEAANAPLVERADRLCMRWTR